MGAENWDEFRTALQVARLGTVSGASEVLGVHHATVIRHIDALEGRLGVKLFQRHARGYTPTEAGEDLLKVAAVTEEQLTQLVGRIKGRSDVVTGDLIITTVTGMAETLIPTLARFQREHPDLKIRLLSDNRLFRLEYGEAHLAIRAGTKPQEPDNVVQHLTSFSPKLCASRDYVERFGVPKSISEYKEHRFVGTEIVAAEAPHFRWMREHVPSENVVFRASELRAQHAAVVAGVGIGFVTNRVLELPSDLVVIAENCDAWQAHLWLVTHVDLHRTAKVQAILKHLKAEAQTWGDA